MASDTIVALSTPPGEGGIGIIRLSGKNALDIALKIFIPGNINNKKREFPVISRRLTYGHIYDEDNNIIDEVLFCYMPAPYTYTREDVVEINAHGGSIILKTILNLLIKKGARLAEPGEFTKRAYLNGRIDLIQAESILSIIQAKSLQGLKAAQQNLHGLLSNEIKNILLDLQDILAEIEAGLDFTQDDLEDEIASYEIIRERIQNLISLVKKLQEKSQRGRILQDGLKTVIVGRPNVGKSSLYNYFLGEERAIVTELPGTTRDLLIENINLKGIQLNIIDTAGIHKKGETDLVEKIGISYSKKAIEDADFIIFMLDSSCGVTEEDIWIFNNLLIDKKENLLFIANKIDLNKKISDEDFRKIFDAKSFIKVSLKNKEGLKEIENKIEEFFSSRNVFTESVIVLQIRHEELISKVLTYLQNALDSMNNNTPLDLIVIDLKLAKDTLHEMLGESISEDHLDKIFSRFCIGK